MKTLDAPVGEDSKSYTGLHYFLPRGIIDIQGTVAQGAAGTYQLKVTRHNEPDRTQRYRLVQRNSGLYEDTTDIQVNDKGLLTDKLSLTSESKTGDIVSSLTDTFVNVATIAAKFSGPGGVMTGATNENQTPSPPPLKPFNVSFDPLIRSEVNHARDIAERAGFLLSVERTGMGVNAAKDQSAQLVSGGGVSRNGVFYRPLTTVKLKIEQIRDLDQSETTLSINVPIPDVQSIAVFDLHRAPFVKKETQLTFADGELRALHHVKPSEVYGAVQIPANATKKIVDALPTIGSLFYKPEPKPNDDLAAKTAHLQAQQALYNQEVATAQAKKQAQAAVPGSPQSTVTAMGSADTASTNDTEAKADQKRTDAKITELQQQFEKLKSDKIGSMDHSRQTDKEKEQQPAGTPTPSP
jgi:hypothetical protein